MEGKVDAVCLGKVKTQPKEEQPEIELQPGIGVLGDAHAGTEKEVSLIAREDVESFTKKTEIEAPPGSFAENITTRGIILVDLKMGDRLTIGETGIEIIAIGKDPFSTHTYSYKGHSLLPTRGVFARVIRGGKVRKGDPIKTG